MGKKITNSEYDYTIRAKACAEDDFWGQVRRTINGVAVSEEQIDKIVKAIDSNLDFRSDDVLLDIGCGNGALTKYFFPKCVGVEGVDRSSYLIEVAKKHFEILPNYVFSQADAIEYISNIPNPERFTKVLCYGVFSFFSPQDAFQFLYILAKRFYNIRLIFIGNIRDLDLAHKFYKKEGDWLSSVRDHTSTMGCWRTRQEMKQLVQKAGWKVQFHKMPKDFYAHEYYYDALLY